MKQSLPQSIFQLQRGLNSRRRKQVFMLVALMIVASFAEIISLGSVLPFLGVITAPEQVYGHRYLQPIIIFFNITSPSQLIFPATVAFIVATLVAALIRLILLYSMTRFTFSVGADISIDVYRRTLYQDYLVHVSRNSSEVINAVVNKVNIVVNDVLFQILMLVSSVFIFLGIVSILFTINVMISSIAFTGFGLIYWIVIHFSSKRLEDNGVSIATNSTKLVKTLQEGLGGIRDVIIDGTQEFYSQVYHKADILQRRAQGENVFISSSPRLIIEGLSIALIAILAYYLSQKSDNILTILPILGALTLGVQRILPVLQQVYSSWSMIKGSKSSLVDVLDLLEQPLSNYVDNLSTSSIPFENNINLIDLGFRYTANSPWVIKDINLQLRKGSCVGFIGPTGSGKSTLLDIIMGLLQPSNGVIMIDDKVITTDNCHDWRACIAHVPQSIFLADCTIAENIAFGMSKDKIDFELVQKVACQAQLSSFIDGLSQQYETLVGERGIRLSGGQRQRIGIARALYKEADVIIFDEATSALDNETERLIMKTINELEGELTLLIIAHRLTTLRDCSQIVELDSGNISRVGTYDELIIN